MNTRSILVFLAACLLAGCAVPSRPKLESFPRMETDFERCPDELRKEYEDIAKYEGSISRYFFQNHNTRPPIDTLVGEWGEPTRKRISFWNLEGPLITSALGMSGPWIAGFSAFIWTTLPHTVYTWEKGQYTIQCIAINPLADGYDPFLQYWIWTYNGPDCGKLERAEVAVKKE